MSIIAIASHANDGRISMEPYYSVPVVEIVQHYGIFVAVRTGLTYCHRQASPGP